MFWFLTRLTQQKLSVFWTKIGPNAKELLSIIYWNWLNQYLNSSNLVFKENYFTSTNYLNITPPFTHYCIFLIQKKEFQYWIIITIFWSSFNAFLCCKISRINRKMPVTFRMFIMKKKKKCLNEWMYVSLNITSIISTYLHIVYLIVHSMPPTHTNNHY